MGTSSIYKGPKDRDPLLPEGFEEEYDKEEEKTQEDIEIIAPWKAAKTAMSQYIKESHSNRGRVFRSYTRALGGSKNAASTARSGIKSAVNLGRLLSTISSEGFETTFQRLSIDFRGKGVEELFSTLVNVLVPESNTKEDIIARKASVEALSQLYEFVVQHDMDIKILDSLDESLFNKVMSTFISSFIFERLLNDLESRFEIYASNVELAISKELEVKEYVHQNTEVRLREVNFKGFNYRQVSIENVIQNIYKECYEVLEGYV
ncbi:Qat anti-phage system associated protein QatB [Bacillus sp. I-2]|uniref:Qat anti-phage system associated protein QatB n=1 Tax=Bacillus sp. I-2 TaxID=1857572 RepID=UPI00097859B2|nr:Qat anti-phage system associated protein QatB [Bacillus sp. I-2]OMP29204.1 hypothetical protein BAE31_18040 [Bacillus sp. I-2]